MNKNIILDNEISFREHDQSDMDYRVKWLNNPEINKYIGDSQVNTSREKQQEWFSRYKSDESKKFYTICADTKPIGIVGLSHIDYKEKEANLFIVIGEKEYQSKGIGKKAVGFMVGYGFNSLGLGRILSEVYAENNQARKCYQSAGFSDDAVESNKIDNKKYEMIIMSIYNKKIR